MSNKPILAKLLAVSLLSVVLTAEARSMEVKSLITNCDANPNCSHGGFNADTGILFRLRDKNRSSKVLCYQDGLCLVVTSPGRRLSPEDAATLFATY